MRHLATWENTTVALLQLRMDRFSLFNEKHSYADKMMTSEVGGRCDHKSILQIIWISYLDYDDNVSDYFCVVLLFALTDNQGFLLQM